MSKKQSSSQTSTLASKVLSGAVKPTPSQAKTLAASVLSQDEKKGNQSRLAFWVVIAFCVFIVIIPFTYVNSYIRNKKTQAGQAVKPAHLGHAICFTLLVWAKRASANEALFPISSTEKCMAFCP